MALKKIPTEGGSGGGRGHSNMEHHLHTEEIKDAARKRRRRNDARAVREQTHTELSSTPPCRLTRRS
jgi:hypothetical protein